MTCTAFIKQRLIYRFFKTLFIILLTYSICPAQEKPSPIAEEKNIFTSEEIDKMNVSNVIEVLEMVPGVTSAGMGISINGSMEILVLLDGRSIKDPISGEIKWDQISLNNIGRIEVIKGGGSEYGENSSGGVILITSKLADTFKGNAEAAAGNMSYRSYSADVQARAGGVKIGIMAGYDSDGGWRENEHEKNTRAGLNLSFSPGDDIILSPSINYLKELKGLGGPYFAPTPYNDVKYENFSATLIAGIKRVNSKSIFSDSTDQSIDAPPAPIPHDIKINPRIFSQEFITDFSLNSWGRLNMGAGYEHVTIDVETNINNIQLPSESHLEKKAWMFTTYKIDSKNNTYSLYLGLRGIYYNNFDNSINPELSLGYNRGTYGAVFSFNLNDRLPAYRDRYRSDAFVVANPNLGKEEYTNYKLSFFFSPVETVSINITPYYSEIEEMISMDTVTTENGTQRTFVNIGSATEKGFDSSISWKPDRRFNLLLTYNYKCAKDDETGLWLPMRARHRFQGKILAIPVEDLSISTTANWSSEEFSDSANTISVGSFWEVDGRIEYDIKDINLFFQIENMFNREHITPFLIPGKTRFFYTGIKYSF